MPRTLNGLHLSNTDRNGWDQMLRVIGDTGVVTLLHFQMDAYAALRHNSQRFLHIRAYHPHSLSQDPRRWAEDVVKALGHAWDDPLCGVSSANELNLHYECGDPDPGHQAQYQTVAHYQRIATWDAAFWRRVDELVPNRQALRVSPALADGHEPPGYAPDGEYTAPEVRAMLEASDLVGLHPYALLHENLQSGALGKDRYWYMLRPFRPVGWEGPSDPGGVVSQLPHKRFLVTETGTFTHADRARTGDTWLELDAFFWFCARSGKVVGVTPFIWSSGPEHGANNLWPNAELRGLLETAPRYTTSAEIPTRQTSVSPPPPPPPPPLGDPPPMPSRLLHPWPLYNQLDDWTTDADGADENRLLNCGPECLAMVVKWATGVEMPADFIKDTLKGPGYTGVTTLQDLASFLTRRCETPCDLTPVGAPTTLLRPLVERTLTTGYPMIVLFSGNGADLAETVGHFMVVVGYDEVGVTCADPWGGRLRTLTWPTFERLHRLAQALVVKRRRDNQLAAYV